MARSVELGTEREIKLPQGSIRYRERGEGETIVFVHGLLVNGDLWRKVVPRLAAFRCITPDWPLGSHDLPMSAGADLSPPGLAAIIADFLAALDLDDVTIVANDTGGALSQILVTERPERIARLVLTSCDSFDNFLPPAFRPLQRMAVLPGAVSLLMRLMQFRPLAHLPMAYGWLTKRGLDAEALASYAAPAIRNAGVRRDVVKILRGISSRYTLAAAEKFSRFDRPVLLAWSRQDRFFPLEHAVEMSKRFPRAQLDPIDDAYTFSAEDQPERLASAIREFVQPRLKAVV